MIIRAATEADVPEMGQFSVATWLAAHRGQVPEGQWQARQQNWTPEKSARGWAETLRDMAAGKAPDFCIYLALATAASPEIIGLVMGGRARGGPWPEAGEIYALYVREDEQGQGIGQKLLAAAVRYLTQRGMNKLIIGCLDSNEPACGFYEACGGQKVGDVKTEDYGYSERQWLYGWEDSTILYNRQQV